MTGGCELVYVTQRMIDYVYIFSTIGFTVYGHVCGGFPNLVVYRRITDKLEVPFSVSCLILLFYQGFLQPFGVTCMDGGND